MSNPSADDEKSKWIKQLQQIVDRTPVLVGYWDASGHNLVANAGYNKYFGMEPGAIRGMHYSDFLGHELCAFAAPYIKGVLEGVEQSFERSMVTDAGDTLHMHTSYLPDIVDDEVVGFYALITDITARVTAENERDTAQHIFQSMMHHAPIGMAVLDADGVMTHVNRAFTELLGYTQEELQTLTFRDLTHPDDLVALEREIEELANGTTDTMCAEKRYIVKDGSVIWAQRNAVFVPETEGGGAIVIVQIQDITARKASEDRLARNAVTDALTGLSNRHFLIEQMETMGARRDSEPFGVLFVDIDDFKRVNDKFGHAEGDKVLIEVAGRLRSAVRRSDVLCRIGGDEFVVLANYASSTSEIDRLTERVRSAINGIYQVGDATIGITASVGSSWSDTLDLEALLKAADTQMYRDKNERD